LALQPQTASALNGRGLAKSHLGDVAAGKADMDAALDADPQVAAN